jgi:hypothetical protein
MDDAQIPSDAGDAKSTPMRRSSLRLRDAEDVAATRLDMFGDPTVKDSLAGAASRSGDGDTPPAAGAAPVDPPQASADGAPLALPALPASDGLPPVMLPPPPVEHRLDAGIDRGDAEPPTAVAEAEPQSGMPGPGQAPEAADGAPQEERRSEPALIGPFGVPFMMPPGSSEQGGFADMSGPMNAPPRFREDLVREPPPPIVTDAPVIDAVETTGTDASVADAAATYAIVPDAVIADPVVTDASALPDGADYPPADLDQEPRYAEFQPHVEEDPPFSGFSASSPSSAAEARTFREPSPIPAEPVQPQSSPLYDAAAKIAAEANATAEALENLKRMLGQKLPDLQPVVTSYGTEPDDIERSWIEPARPATPLADSLRLRMQGLEVEPPTFPSAPSAPLMPLPQAPRRSSRAVYVLGFLTGLVLSLMAGLVLYFFIINAG